MKYKGQKLDGPSEDYIVFPRREEDIVFCVRAIINYDECDKLDPRPEPPLRLLPGGKSGRTQANVEDPKFKEELNKWAERRTHYMIIKSLEPSEDIEWEQVKLEDPSTWELAEKELAEAGFTAAEVTMLIRKIMQVNGLDEDKIKEATESFLVGQANIQSELISQNSEQSDTPSGEPVNA
jgi:hypothetical protein